MEPQVAQIASVVVGLLVGMVVAGLLMWLAMRARIETAGREASGSSQVEIVRLSERAASLGDELERERTRAQGYEVTVANYRTELNAAQAECAQLRERANRVPVVEAQVSTLQSRLAEETERAAGLHEQSKRLPELEQALEAASRQIQQMNQQIADLRGQLGGSESKSEEQRLRVIQLEEQTGQLADKRDQLQADQEGLKTRLAELASSLTAEREQALEKLALLEGAKQQLSDTFKSLANDILEEKSQRFTEHNKTNIGQILEPLKLRLVEFQSKVDQVYVQEGKDRTALGEQVRQLTALNQQLSEDAQNLARALKGSSKAQGNWGELILERVLDVSGLTKGRMTDRCETTNCKLVEDRSGNHELQKHDNPGTDGTYPEHCDRIVLDVGLLPGPAHSLSAG